MSLERRLEAVRRLFERIEKDFLPARLACSYGAEDMVLVDLVAREFPRVGVFMIDTGRLPRETLALHERVRTHYGLDVAVYLPQPDSVEAYVAAHGRDGFYDSPEIRRACCHVRKVEPLGRALAQHRAWITGLRRAQAASSSPTPPATSSTRATW